jgi:YbgC/YbaW family acyl-CoA thioester hydrolase
MKGDAVPAVSQSMHTCSLSVRSYECDSYGHVNNAVYLHYLEYARHQYLHDIGVCIPELRELGFGLLVAKVSIEYRRPAVTDDLLTINTSAVRQAIVGGVLRQVITKAGTASENGSPPVVVAEAQVTWVCVDARGRPVRLPAAFQQESPPS